MTIQPWVRRVPASAEPPTVVPLDYDDLVEQSIPVKKALVVTASGGVTIALPAALTAIISTAAEYGVQLSKQGFDPRGGEAYVEESTKTTSQFVIKTTGDSFGSEKIFYTVFWMPAS